MPGRQSVQEGGLFGPALGGLVILVSLVVLPLWFREEPRFGLALLGAYIALRGTIRRNPSAHRWACKLERSAAATYLSLLLVEISLIAFGVGAHPQSYENPWPSIRGLFAESPRMGFRNTPGWRGTFDNGLVQAAIAINSRGDRDDEPGAGDPKRERVLLLGDSLAFGYGLSRPETIERRIETLSGGAYDIYNLGTIAYSVSHIIEKLRANDWWEGSAAVYLFSNTDLADLPLDHYAVYEGYLVRRYHPDGKPRSEDELRKEMALWLSRHDRKPRSFRFNRIVTLHTIRGQIEDMLRRDARDSWPGHYTPQTIAGAVEKTQTLRDVASKRAERFFVVIIPNLAEARKRTYANSTTRYMEALRTAGIELIEVRDRLNTKDYFAVDRHLTPTGARIVAEAILERLDQD